MLSAPALHSEEPGSGSAAPLSIPQLNDAADSESGRRTSGFASPEEGASPAAPATAGDAAATAPAPVAPDYLPPAGEAARQRRRSFLSLRSGEAI
ncbi:hypothetical protein MJK72_27340 [Klebsiella pneumoniae]|nr:hypothetical protein MJK72_27340 [Klebsiella pneumoniae]